MNCSSAPQLTGSSQTARRQTTRSSLLSHRTAAPHCEHTAYSGPTLHSSHVGPPLPYVPLPVPALPRATRPAKAGAVVPQQGLRPADARMTGRRPISARAGRYVTRRSGSPERRCTAGAVGCKGAPSPRRTAPKWSAADRWHMYIVYCIYFADNMPVPIPPRHPRPIAVTVTQAVTSQT